MPLIPLTFCIPLSEVVYLSSSENIVSLPKGVSSIPYFPVSSPPYHPLLHLITCFYLHHPFSVLLPWIHHCFSCHLPYFPLPIAMPLVIWYLGANFLHEPLHMCLASTPPPPFTPPYHSVVAHTWRKRDHSSVQGFYHWSHQKTFRSLVRHS